MASKERLLFWYTQFPTQVDLDAILPPDISYVDGVISITTEWEENRWFFGPKRRRHTETWYVTADAHTYDLIANLLPESPATRPSGKSARHVEVDSLPHYFTVHTESVLDGDFVNGVKVIRWSEGNLMPWNETNLVPSILTGTKEAEIERKDDNIHLALVLLQAIVNCIHGWRFSRVLFPRYKQYMRAGTGWQWYRGHWMNGKVENWWDADKAVADARKALYTRMWQGKAI